MTRITDYFGASLDISLRQGLQDSNPWHTGPLLRPRRERPRNRRAADKRDEIASLHVTALPDFMITDCAWVVRVKDHARGSH
jgi:hypothetical protein